MLFECEEAMLEREALHGNVTGAEAVILDKSLCMHFKWSKLELLYFPLSPKTMLN